MFALLLSLLFVSQLFGQGVEEDWPKFLGPRGDGSSAETNILKDWSGDKLKTNWQLPVGEGYAIGSIADGSYFHFDVTTSEEGKNVARLRRIDLNSGKKQWEFTAPSSYKDMYGYDSGPRTSPVIEGDHVYVYGVEGTLFCLRTKDGSEVWKLNTSERFGVVQNFFGVSSCPVIYENLLLVMVGGSPEDSRKLPRGRLDLVQPAGSAMVALNRLTGELVYKTGNDLASYTSPRIVELHGQPIALAWMRESLIGFRPANGQIMFKFPWRARKLESVNASTPVVFGNQVFIGECYEKGGVLLDIMNSPDAENELAWTAKPAWSDNGKRDKSMAPHWNTPVIFDGHLYGCSGRHQGSAVFKCIQWQTGETKWSVPRLGRTSATLCDGHLITMAENGELLLVKATPDKFDMVSRYEGDIKFRSPCWAAPIVSHGKLIVRGSEKVVCFSLKGDDS
jgi:outer membrane protein assembly factor BamB